MFVTFLVHTAFAWVEALNITVFQTYILKRDCILILYLEITVLS